MLLLNWTGVIEQNGVHLNIDRVTSFPGDPMELGILGWCWSPKHRLTELRLDSETHSAPCLTELPRSDVADYFGDPNASYAGIACRVQIPDSPDPVRFVARVDGEIQTLVEIPVPACEPAASTETVSTYAEWLAQCEPRLFSEALPPGIETPQGPPQVSILLPANDAPLYYLHRSILSVLRQRHPSWELCIVCDGFTDPEIRSHMGWHEQHDSRIRILLPSAAGSTSQAFNTGCSNARGRYIVPLVAGDELHPGALLEIALSLEQQPGAELLYSDEDRIDDEGRRSSPLFKPAFDPDLLLAFNHTGHPIAIRRDALERAGGYRDECDGARDWDLVLRIGEMAGASSIAHLPKLLYHARAKWDAAAMPDAGACRRVLEDHLKRTGRAGSVREGLFPGSMRLSPARNPVCRTAVIYRREDGDYQLEAIRRTRGGCLEVYELTEGTLRPVCCPGPEVTAWQDLEGDVVVMVNAPIEYFNHTFFEALADCARQPDCGLAGPLVLTPEGRVLSAGLVGTEKSGLLDPFAGNWFVNRGYMGLAKATRRVAAVSSHCFAVSRTRLCEIAGAQPAGNTDFTGIHELLVRSAHADGLKVLYSPYAVATVAGSPAGAIPDACAGPGVPRVNPNIEAFASPGAIFEQEILS